VLTQTFYIKMENKESIEQALDKMNINIIKKQKVSPLQSVSIFTSGIVLLIVNSMMNFDSQSIFPPMLILLSFALTLWGLLSFIFRKKIYVNNMDNQKLVAKEALFDVKEREKLVRIMATQNYPELKNLIISNHDGLKLRYFATKDASLCFSQVIAYVPYEFVRITDVQTHAGDDAQNLIKSLKL